MPFKSLNEFLTFYERNRNNFQSIESYVLLLRKLSTLIELEKKGVIEPAKEEKRVRYRQRVFKDLIATDFARKIEQASGKEESLAITDPMVFKVFRKIWRNFVEPKYKYPRPIIGAFSDFKQQGLTMKQLQEKVYERAEYLISNDKIKDLQPNEIYELLQCFGLVKVTPHNQLLYLLEPHILKYIDEFTPTQIAYMVTYYNTMQRGSVTLLKILLTYAQNESESYSMDLLSQLLNALGSNFFLKEVEIEPFIPARNFLKAAMKKLDHAKPKHLKFLIKALDKFEIKDKAYYELLSVTFSKMSDQFMIKEKAEIIYKLTKPKIDEASIFYRTQETLREYLSMFLFNSSLNEKGEMDLMYLQLEGVFSPRQILYLEEQYSRNKKEVEQKKEVLKELNRENYYKAASYLHIETMSYIKLLW